MPAKTIYLLIFYAIFSCKKGNGIPEVNAKEPTSHAFQGLWVGFITYTMDDATHEIKAIFDGNAYEFRLIDDEGAFNKGQFQQIESSIYMEIIESNMSGLGLVDDSPVKFSFRLTNKHLILENSNGKIDLKREDGTESPDTAPKDVYRQWNCLGTVNDQNQLWVLKVKDNDDFIIAIKKGTSTVRMSGSIIWDQKPERGTFQGRVASQNTEFNYPFVYTMDTQSLSIFPSLDTQFDCQPY